MTSRTVKNKSEQDREARDKAAREQSRGPFRFGRRTFNTFFDILGRGQSPTDQPNTSLTARERKDFEPTSKSPLFFLASKRVKDAILAKEAEEKRKKGR